MSRKVQEEAANWTKAISGLTITKNGLIVSIKELLKDFLYSFSPELHDHLSEFLENTQKGNVKFIIEKDKKKGSWKIALGCCTSGRCQAILDILWEKHKNKSKNVVWSPDGETSKLYTLNKTKTTLQYNHLLGPFLRSINSNDDVNEFYWQIANMYMFRGKEKNNFPNTGPEDTDAALIFKLMKNCKLFSLDEENDIDNGIYEDLLEVRNLLMHSADNCLSDEALEECFQRMESILKASKFSNEYSNKAIAELKELKNMRIIMTALTSQQAAVVKEAFKIQQSSLEFDINVKGSLKNDYVLEAILKASKDKSRKYTADTSTNQTPAPPSQTPAPPSQGNVGAVSGATTGAILGAVGGPPGAAIGAAIGGMFGKMFD